MKKEPKYDVGDLVHYCIIDTDFFFPTITFLQNEVIEVQISAECISYVLSTSSSTFTTYSQREYKPILERFVFSNQKDCFLAVKKALSERLEKIDERLKKVN